MANKRDGWLRERRVANQRDEWLIRGMIGL